MTYIQRDQLEQQLHLANCALHASLCEAKLNSTSLYSKHVVLVLVCNMHSVFAIKKKLLLPLAAVPLAYSAKSYVEISKVNSPGVSEVVTALQLHSHFWR